MPDRRSRTAESALRPPPRAENRPLTKSILYVGCPASERAEVETLFAATNLSVVCADSGAHAVAELQRQELPVLLDLAGGARVLEMVEELRTCRPNALVFAVADTRRPGLTVEAVLTGVADVFARPLGARQLLNAIDRERVYVSPSGPARPAGTFHDTLYSHAPAMREVTAFMTRAAAMRAGVLISGEEGSGRQFVAHAIHRARSDGTGKFVAVDCAACDGDHLDEELFGSAARSPNGDLVRGLERVSCNSRLHDALGGTVYLQNVVDAPARVQARLARVLRDREAVLVETGAPIGFDVRPMAGVDAPFKHKLQDGRLRDDLFRRLSVLQINLPPLRNRREDIPALANYFVREICASRHGPRKTLSRPALSLISALPWRGNADELRAVLEHVIAGVRSSHAIAVEDVLAHVRLDGGAALVGTGGTLRQARARFEREYIAAVLEQHDCRISEAAKALGVQRTNLYRKMRVLRVPRERRR